MNKTKEPKHFLTFRIIGFCSLAVGIILIILGCVVFRMPFGNGTTENFALLVPGMFLTVSCAPCLFIGFAPKISKMQVESAKYMQQSNKDDLTDIANTSADISSEAISKSAKAIKSGLNETKFCKHCGAKIDIDSKFCKDCGKAQ